MGIFLPKHHRPPWPGHPGPPLAELRPGIGPTDLPAPLPLLMSAIVAQGRRPSAADARALQSSVSHGGRRKKMAFLPKTPSPSRYLLKNPHPCNPFSQKALPIFLIANKPSHHIYLILNKPLHLFSMSRIFPEIMIRPFHSQK